MNNNEGINELEKTVSMVESMISEPDGVFCESKLSWLYNSPDTSENGIKGFIDSAKEMVNVIRNVIEQLTQLEIQFPNERHTTIKIKERYVKCEQYYLMMINKMQEWNR